MATRQGMLKERERIEKAQEREREREKREVNVREAPPVPVQPNIYSIISIRLVLQII